MSWIDRAEAKFGHFAIPSLLRYVAGLNAFCFVLYALNPLFLNLLVLDRNLVLQGQVWRLVSYIFIPAIGGFFPGWLAAAMYIYYLIWIGDGLEEAIGAFRLTLFYVLGMFGTTLAAFLIEIGPGGFLLNTSLLFAFVRFYPDTMIYLFYVLPVKVKWIAWFTAASLLFGFVTGGLAFQVAVVVALANYLLFFGREIAQAARQRRDLSQRRHRFESAAHSADDALHLCEVCGRTELVAPELEFRVARDGQEYCTEHLPKPAAPPTQV